jgi:CheY-like chemotaxis protein
MAIMGFSEILTYSDRNSEELEMVNNIFNSAKRLSDTLNLLLDLAKAESENFNMKKEKVEVVSIVKEIVTSFSEEAKKKNIDLYFLSSQSELIADVDKYLFTEIIRNLVNNALKFTFAGNVTVEITGNYKGDEHFFSILVSDTGIGIPENKKEIIFEEFRQVSEGLGRGFEGSGLGLTLSKRMARVMDGTISLDTKLGEGSVFTVRFPYIPGLIPDEIYSDNNQKFEYKSEEHATKEKLRVLIVEDDVEQSSIFKIFLEKSCDADVANDSETALHFVQHNEYDVILMDINLGEDINGLELAKIIKNNHNFKKSEVVAVTAYAQEKERNEILQNGIEHYISKPFSRNELIKLVYSAVENKK